MNNFPPFLVTKPTGKKVSLISTQAEFWCLSLPRKQWHSTLCLVLLIVFHSKPPTLVKWGHTEGIGREKTSSQNSQGIALDFWTLFSLSNLRAKYNWRAIHAEYDALIFWYKYLQKVNAMPSDFWWKKHFCLFDK